MNADFVQDEYDVVIIGAGAAGLSAALAVVQSSRFAELKAHGRTPRLLVISKLQALRSHTGSAEGGIAASLGNLEHDDWHWHYYDTVKGGDWLVDQDAAAILAQYAPQTVVNLERRGVAFSRTEDGHIAQRKFGGHTAEFGKAPVRRAAYAADRIGHQILYALWQQCVGAGVRFAEEWYVTDLVLSGSVHSGSAHSDSAPGDSMSGDSTPNDSVPNGSAHIDSTPGDSVPGDSASDGSAPNSSRCNTNDGNNDGRTADGPRKVCGVVAFDMHTGKTHAIATHNVLMATGGAGRLFHTTSNSWDLTGDGMALALKAGLQLEDAEFVQFHPTGLAHMGILLSEASRGEGGILRNADGEAFMARYAPEHRDLAARDVVSRSIVAEVDAGRGVADPKDPDGPKDCVWLDMTGIDPERMEQLLPQVVETIRNYAGLDPTTQWVPVKPTAHYTMGGIPITVNGEVYQWRGDTRHVVDGLYAAGECSCVSVHGANRLGGNSLLDACLFGSRAGESIAGRLAAESHAGQSGSEEQGPDESEAIETDAASRNVGVSSHREDAATIPDELRAAAKARSLDVAGLLADDEQDRTDQRDPAQGRHETVEVEADRSSANAVSDRQVSAPSTDAAAPSTNPDAAGSGTDPADGPAERMQDENPYELLGELGNAMEKAVAVRCDATTIKRAQALIADSLAPRARNLRSHSSTAAFNQELTAIWEIRNLIELGRCVLESSAARHESRGAFTRTDFPDRGDERFLKHSMTDETGNVSWQPVHIVDMPPRSRAY